MKIGKLYIKIFLSFVLVLIVTEILVFGLFVFASGRTFRSRFEQYTGVAVLIAKEAFEGRIKTESDKPLRENESLKDLISRFGEALEAKIWVAAPDGTPLLKSFRGDIPDDLSRISRRYVKDFGHFKLYHGFKHPWDSYATLPIEVRNGEMGSLNILFEKIRSSHHEEGFIIGLVVLGIVIALLIIPVSRLITGPLKQLRLSALRIAEGDLSHRAEVKSKDEIGELGRSFNHMADRLERMIRSGRELTANISHELRSPLARIRIAEELIRERLGRNDNENLERLLDDIQGDIEELDHLIGRTLALSKMDIQETALKLEAIDPSDIIRKLLERLKPVISHRDLHIKTKLSFDPPFFGDKETLRTAFSNVFENAVKFTPEKGDMSVEMSSEQDFLKISVFNTFESLPQEDLVSIFEPFYRTEQSRASGSGLGLAITKKIIEKHDGNIKALNSTEGLEIQIKLPFLHPLA